MSDSDSDADSERWECENKHDPISPSDMCELQNSPPDQVAAIYWIMRKAVGRYPVAAGRFQPRRRVTGSKRFRRFRRKGARPGGRGRKGFYVAGTFISLDEIPEDTLEVCFEGGGKRKKGLAR